MEKFEESDSTKKLGFTFLLILAGAFFLRMWQIEIKPVHFDEGINGHFVASIWRNGFYRYDPTNFHGPLYFYILQLTELIFGFGISGYRFVTGLLQIATLIIIARHKRFVGSAAVPAALIVAVSTAFVFYSRYAIHESLFILGQVAFSYGYFSYRADKSIRSIWWMALSVVVLVTTKETFFIFLGTWAIAVGIVNLIDAYFPRFGSGTQSIQKKSPPASDWISVGLVAVVLTLALFTGFFMFPQGAVDMFTALKVWTKTGTGQTGHEKPFFYWITLFRQYEWAMLIALFLSPVVFFKSQRSLRILVLVGFGTWLAYSIIPYKTPWLILSLIWPLAFSAGALIGRTIPSFRWVGVRSALALATLVCVIVSMGAMWKLNFHNFASRNEPYVYVQSTNDFKRAVDTIFRLVEKKPEARTFKIAAINRDPWPLPYLLMPMTNVHWGRASDSVIADADVILSDADDRALIESKLIGKFFVLPFQIRDAYQEGQAYYRFEKFNEVLPASTAVFNGTLLNPGVPK